MQLAAPARFIQQCRLSAYVVCETHSQSSQSTLCSRIVHKQPKRGDKKIVEKGTAAHWRWIFIHVTLALPLQTRPNTVDVDTYSLSPLPSDHFAIGSWFGGYFDRRLLQRSAQRQRGKHTDRSKGRRVRDVTHHSSIFFVVHLWRVKLWSVFYARLTVRVKPRVCAQRAHRLH